MDIEELKEALGTDEGKALLNALTESAVEEKIKGLKDKNGEIIAQNKSLKEKLTQIEVDKQKALEEANLKSGDIEKIKATYESKIADLSTSFDTEKSKLSSQLHEVLIDNGLNDALTQAQVAPHHMKAVKALIKSEHNPAIGEVEGKTAAVIDGKPLNEFISSWAQSDSAKYYVSAPDNSGGGAKGENSGGKATGGNLGGDKSSRVQAIKSKFPELN